MWPLPPIRDEYIALSMRQTELAIAWLGRSKKHPLVLRAYYKTAFDTISSARITHELQQFVTTHNLSHAMASCALAAPLVHEQLMRLCHATPAPADFLSPSLKKLLWDYRYLHALDDGQHLFYVCGITRPALFAQQLLMHATNLNLVSVTSSYMALLQAYRALYGPAFRQSHLAIAMMRHEYQLQNSISVTNLARLIHIPSVLTLDLEIEKLPLLTMIGLYYQERE